MRERERGREGERERVAPASSLRPFPLSIPATKQFLLMSQLKQLRWEGGRKRERERGGGGETERVSGSSL